MYIHCIYLEDGVQVHGAPVNVGDLEGHSLHTCELTVGYIHVYIYTTSQ